MELDEYSRVDIKAKTRAYAAIARARNARSNSVAPANAARPKTLIFVKLNEQVG